MFRHRDILLCTTVPLKNSMNINVHFLRAADFSAPSSCHQLKCVWGLAGIQKINIHITGFSVYESTPYNYRNNRLYVAIQCHVFHQPGDALSLFFSSSFLVKQHLISLRRRIANRKRGADMRILKQTLHCEIQVVVLSLQTI